MKLANVNGRAALVVSSNGTEGTVDVHEASSGCFGPDLQAIYTHWDAFVAWAAGADLSKTTPLVNGELCAPSPQPKQIFAIGLNYRAHAAEGGRDVPKAPAVFTKYHACLAGPYVDVPSVAGRHDYEAELVVVIGKTAHKVAEADAWSYVAGVTCGQDYSERDTQNASGGHFSLGKSFPNFGPTGPYLVSVDELPNKDDLAISCTVSGDVRQSSRTSMMVFPVATLIAHISSIVPLYSGDIIFTGTPEGVGYARTPPMLLSPGHVVVTTIEGIGSIEQRIV